MRWSGFSIGILGIVCILPLHAEGQNGDSHRGATQLAPYHQHHDTRHGHDHFYPDRGAIVRDAPQGASVVSYAGLAYRFGDGIWLEPRGPAFMVVAPPIGLIVPALPPFVTVLAHGGELYLYANDVYYRPRPDLNGYEVVNDPAEPPLSAGPDEVVGPQPPDASARSPQAAASTSASPGAATEAPAAKPIPVPGSVAVPAPVSGPTAAATPATVTAPTAAASVAAGGTPASSSSAAAPVVPAVGPPLPATSAATLASKAAVAPGTTSAATGAAAPAVPIATPAGTSAAAGSGATPAATGPATPAAPPAGSSSASSSSSAPGGTRVALAPRNGQTADQEARDRYECYRFAVTQSGFDPLRYGAPSASNGEPQSAYARAQAACFEARGYSVR